MVSSAFRREFVSFMAAVMAVLWATDWTTLGDRMEGGGGATCWSE